jgi:hypothetical protein
LTGSWVTSLLAEPFQSRRFLVDLLDPFGDPLGQAFLFQPFARGLIRLFRDPVQQVSIDLPESRLIEFSNHCEIDVLERHDVTIGGPINERMVPLVIHGIDGRRIVSIGPGNNHPRHFHGVKL